MKIAKDIEKLTKTIRNAPRIWAFHGRRVVHNADWKWADWTTLPDRYNILIVFNSGKNIPEKWLDDYYALLAEVKDPQFGNHLCYSCVIKKAQDLKREIDRIEHYWKTHGGEKGKRESYEADLERYKASLKEDAMRNVEHEAYDLGGGANGRTCNVINYFRCPFEKERDQLLGSGNFIEEFWEHIKWYDEHWNRDPSSQLPASEMKWCHFDEPPIIDVTDSDDVDKSVGDGRYDKIVREHELYLKERESERE